MHGLHAVGWQVRAVDGRLMVSDEGGHGPEVVKEMAVRAKNRNM
jgi:hypothetical protein